MTKRSTRATVTFVRDKRRRDRIAGVAAITGIAFFVAALGVFSVAGEDWDWLGLALFLAAFCCTVVLHFTNDRENWTDF